MILAAAIIGLHLSTPLPAVGPAPSEIPRVTPVALGDPGLRVEPLRRLPHVSERLHVAPRVRVATAESAAPEIRTPVPLSSVESEIVLLPATEPARAPLVGRLPNEAAIRPVPLAIYISAAGSVLCFALAAAMAVQRQEI